MTCGYLGLNKHCVYHRHNKHKTSNCIEVKHKIQDLLDDGIIRVEDPNDTPKEEEDSTFEYDQNHEPMFSNGLHIASISSTIPSSHKFFQQYSISSSSNNEL